MNKQNPPNGIEWTRLPNPDDPQTTLDGYTWNPVGGCRHNCQWQVNGALVECYAKTVAERVASSKYPNGFDAHYWNPERLAEPGRVKKPSGIFLDSMSDLMGQTVPAQQIQQVLDVCAQTPHHTYFLLTKNAPRLREFVFPSNVWVGVSMAPDYMYGRELSSGQKERYMERALEILAERRFAFGNITWMSAEPLSWDISHLIRNYPNALNWVVIGAASNGRTYYPPQLNHLLPLEKELGNTPVFYKGNMKCLPYAAEHWRKEFPIRRGK